METNTKELYSKIKSDDPYLKRIEKDIVFCANLRDKLKKHQMGFELEEHKDEQYFGYNGYKWNES